MAHICLPLCTLAQQPEKHNFIVCDDKRTSSRVFVQRIAALGRALRADLAVQTDDVVMIASLNTDHMLEALFAACDIGCTATPVNHRWSSTELAAAMQLTRPVCVLVDQQCSQLVRAAANLLDTSCRPVLVQLGAGAQPVPHTPPPPAPERQTSAEPSFEFHAETLIALHLGSGATLQLLTPSTGAAMIIFTSGTTGREKPPSSLPKAPQATVSVAIRSASSRQPSACTQQQHPAPARLAGCTTCL